MLVTFSEFFQLMALVQHVWEASVLPSGPCLPPSDPDLVVSVDVALAPGQEDLQFLASPCFSHCSERMNQYSPWTRASLILKWALSMSANIFIFWV